MFWVSRRFGGPEGDKQMATILICGNTYPVKDALKALGGRWDASAKGWRVPADKADEAQALVSGAPKSSPRASGGKCRCGRQCSPGYSTCYHCSTASKTCRSCGHVERRNRRGYVEGDWVRGGECQSCREERQMGY